MPKVSVIIPVYKVGKYIENSMKSVVAQRFKDFEVLLVDNNTPDDSIQIAKNVLEGTGVDYRVVKQTIQGLPAARNMGIAEAKGEWIVSIDPDDTISEYFLEELYECALKSNLDFIFSKYDEVGAESLFIFPEETKNIPIEYYNRDYVLENLLTRRLPLMVSNMFFKKATFDKLGIRFDQDVILGADLICLWELMVNTEKIAYLNKKLYNHFDRPDSLMTAPSNIKIDSNLAGYIRLCSYIAEHYSDKFSKWVYAREVYALLSTLCIWGTRKLFCENREKYYKKNVYLDMQSFPHGIIRKMNWILYHMPSVFFYFNKIVRNPHSIFNKIIVSIIQ